MGKRKQRPVLHQQEQCDVWLSTAEKKEQTPAAKRQRLLRPITNISDLILSSQPVKAGTKQTDIKHFFAPKLAMGKENAASKASSSSGGISKPTSKARNKRSVSELPKQRTLENTTSFKSRQNNEAESTIAISGTHFNVSEPHLTWASKIDERLTRETDIPLSSQDLNSNELFQISQDIPRISSEDEEAEDMTFTMGTQGCLKVKGSKTRQDVDYDTFDTQECLKTVAEQSDDLLDMVSTNSRRDANKFVKVFSTEGMKSHNDFQRSQDIPKSERPNASVYCDFVQREQSEDVTFTMGSQGCLKVKRSNTKRHIGPDISNTQRCFNTLMANSELSAKSDDVPDSPHSQNIQDTPRVTEDFSQELYESRINEASGDTSFTIGTQGCLEVKQSRCVDNDSHDTQEIGAVNSELCSSQDGIHDSSTPLLKNSNEDVAFTMGSQGCLKVRDSKSRRSNITSEDSLQDVAFTMGCQGCLKVRDSKSQRLHVTPSEDLSQDVASTMGSQGCLKVRDSKSQRSNVTSSEDLSQDVAFTMGSQGCLKVTDRKGHRSNFTSSEDLSQDVAFTMGSQGCLKVRDHKGHRSNFTSSEDLSQDVAFTMGSQGCRKVRDLKGHRSNFTLSEDLSQDVAFSMGSEGCLKVRDPKGHRSNFTSSEDLSQDVAFIMGSQGCLKVRDSKGQRSEIMPSFNQLSGTKCIDSFAQYSDGIHVHVEHGCPDDDDDDQFSQTQDR
eukprot:XP_011665041.1 PREDICTED: uncharacterized protein LOC581131 [Strongylocentrotus purpuratus]